MNKQDGLLVGLAGSTPRGHGLPGSTLGTDALTPTFPLVKSSVKYNIDQCIPNIPEEINTSILSYLDKTFLLTDKQ